MKLPDTELKLTFDTEFITALPIRAVASPLLGRADKNDLTPTEPADSTSSVTETDEGDPPSRILSACYERDGNAKGKATKVGDTCNTVDVLLGKVLVESR